MKDFKQFSQNFSLDGPLPIKIVQIITPRPQMAPLQGLSVFHGKIFKNLLPWNHRAQTFHIWYITSPCDPLPSSIMTPRPKMAPPFKIFKNLLLLSCKAHTLRLWYLACNNFIWSFTKSVKSMNPWLKMAPSWGLLGLHLKSFKNLFL